MVAHERHAGKARIGAGAHRRHGIVGVAAGSQVPSRGGSASCPTARSVPARGNERFDALAALDRKHVAAVDHHAAAAPAMARALRAAPPLRLHRHDGVRPVRACRASRAGAQAPALAAFAGPLGASSKPCTKSPAASASCTTTDRSATRRAARPSTAMPARPASTARRTVSGPIAGMSMRSSCPGFGRLIEHTGERRASARCSPLGDARQHPVGALVALDRLDDRRPPPRQPARRRRDRAGAAGRSPARHRNGTRLRFDAARRALRRRATPAQPRPAHKRESPCFSKKRTTRVSTPSSPPAMMMLTIAGRLAEEAKIGAQRKEIRPAHGADDDDLGAAGALQRGDHAADLSPADHGRGIRRVASRRSRSISRRCARGRRAPLPAGRSRAGSCRFPP